MTTITHVSTLPFEPAEPRSFRGLTLVPLFPRNEPSLDYVALTQALADGLLVTEVDTDGDVQTLLVENPVETLVLLYEGEELVGAKQNRILDRTLLVGARSRQPIPVSCVERGRWSPHQRVFAEAPRAAYPNLRRVKHEGGTQAETWRDVSAKSSRLNAVSRTEAAAEMYTSRTRVLDEYAAALREPQEPVGVGETRRFASPSVVGSELAVGGELVAMSAFSRAS